MTQEEGKAHWACSDEQGLYISSAVAARKRSDGRRAESLHSAPKRWVGVAYDINGRVGCVDIVPFGDPHDSVGMVVWALCRALRSGHCHVGTTFYVSGAITTRVFVCALSSIPVPTVRLLPSQHDRPRHLQLKARCPKVFGQIECLPLVHRKDPLVPLYCQQIDGAQSLRLGFEQVV